MVFHSQLKTLFTAAVIPSPSIDMQDVEFTVENERLWMLQCRNGKRTGVAGKSALVLFHLMNECVCEVLHI